jgi:hypothetical protein
MSVAPTVAPAAPTITLAIQLDRMGVQLTIDYVDGTDKLTVWRIATATGAKAYVRGVVDRASSGTTTQVYDWEVPLNVELIYYAQVDVAGVLSDVGSSAPITIEDDRDWLVDLARPVNTFPIQLESMPELDFAGPVGVHRVLDRRDPILTAAAIWTPSGALSFVTGTREERDRARSVLGAGVPVLVRTPPSEGVGNFYCGVVTMREQRASRLAFHEDRRFVVDVVQVARPDPSVFVPLPTLTYQDRLDTWPLYQDVVNTGMTYSEIAYYFPPGTVDPIPPWLPDDV